MYSIHLGWLYCLEVRALTHEVGYERVINGERVVHVVLLVLVGEGEADGLVVAEHQIVEPLHVHHGDAPLFRLLRFATVDPRKKTRDYKVFSAFLNTTLINIKEQ